MLNGMTRYRPYLKTIYSSLDGNHSPLLSERGQGVRLFGEGYGDEAPGEGYGGEAPYLY
jgi:hypothetical protein